jgi:hypothetical protein
VDLAVIDNACLTLGMHFRYNTILLLFASLQIPECRCLSDMIPKDDMMVLCAKKGYKVDG